MKSIHKQIQRALIEQLEEDGYTVKIIKRRFFHPQLPIHAPLEPDVLALRVVAISEEVQVTIHFHTCMVHIVPNKSRYIYSESTHLAVADIPALVKDIMLREAHVTASGDYEFYTWSRALDLLTRRHGAAAVDQALIDCTLDGNFGVDHMPTLEELEHYL